MNTPRCTVRIAQSHFDELHSHLFPGDHDEHGAVIEAGLSSISGRLNLLVRSIHYPVEGIDWVPGNRGYRMIKASYVRSRIRECRDERLVYLAVHNHGGDRSVAFSSTDIETHERGFPALLDIARGMPVGSLVFAKDAVAGDIWLPDRTRLELDHLVVVGPQRKILLPHPAKAARASDMRFDRQVRIFGDEGQAALSSVRVGIVGLGGVGMLLAQWLGHLGVGSFVLIDHDRIDETNLPRLPGANDIHAMSWLRSERRPEWLRQFGARLARRKVDHAERLIKAANSKANVRKIFGFFENEFAVHQAVDCDYLFLAADMHRARRLFNAVCHQYLIPGVQLGSRVRSDPVSGAVLDISTVVRPVFPDSGCLICNGAVSTKRLHEESISDSMRQRQKYTDEPDLAAPSVMMLNAQCASQAGNDFLMHITGLTAETAFNGYVRTSPRLRKTKLITPRMAHDCLDCSSTADGRYARGDHFDLPLLG